MAVSQLRALLEQRFPNAAPIAHSTTEALATGISLLDNILPNHGLPRGKLSVWTPMGGATALLRSACDAAIALGERAAWVDGEHMISGAFWRPGPLLLRPRDRRGALKAAETLLRSRGFAILVLAGAAPAGPELVRLTRVAREGGTAFVSLTTSTTMASLRLSSQILPDSYQWRATPFGDPADAKRVTVRVRAQAMGWNTTADIPLDIAHHVLRLSLEPRLADRRGVAR